MSVQGIREKQTEGSSEQQVAVTGKVEKVELTVRDAIKYVETKMSVLAVS